MLHSKRAEPALRALAETDPALAALSLWCRHRDGDGPAAATRGDTIDYGPSFMALTRAEQIGLAAHHILHVAFRHSARADAMAARYGPGFDQDLFNIAADAIINETVLLAGYVLPRPRITLTGLLAAALDGQAAKPEAITDWDVERLYTRLASEGAQGKERGSEAAKRHARDAGHEEDLKRGDTGADRHETSSDWQGRLTRALAEGKQAGRGLGRLAGRLGDVPRIDTPWERILRGAITTAVTRDRLPEPFRPSRRWLAMDAAARQGSEPTPAFLAATGRPKPVARIAVLVDASGSVPLRMRDRFAGEVAGIAARTGAEVHVIVFDSEVRETRLLPTHHVAGALRDLQWPEQGGTDFAPAFEAAQLLKPSIIVLLTDLEAEAPRPPGKVPVIWAVPERPAIDPGFGQVIVLDR